MDECLIFGTGASAAKNYEDLKSVVSCAAACGIRMFDTAPSYGVEEILAKVIFDVSQEKGLSREDFIIQTKLDAWQMAEGNIEKFVDCAMQKMKLQYIDNLLVHWPLPDFLDDTWNKMKMMKRSGKVRKIGICNVRIRHLNLYAKHGVFPDIIQIERNPLRTCEREIEFCKQRGIDIQAYSPLCKMDKRLADNAVIKRISEKYNKNIGQIVLRWHLDTGVSPIFTSTKDYRIREYMDLFDFALNQDDIAAISALNINYKYYLESCLCPGF